MTARTAPYTAFSAAFNDLVEPILERGEDVVKAFAESLSQALAEEAYLLLEIAPEFAKIIKAKEAFAAKASISIEKKTAQLHFVVRQFIRVICRSFGPLVVVLDDTQWADRQSLDLAKVLLTDRESCFVLTATYRTNEVDEQHDFTNFMTPLKDEEPVVVESIEIGNLTEKASHEVVAEALRSAVDRVENLASEVYQKTAGNAFFLVNFLKSLVDDGHLTFNVGLMDWSWDDSTIESLQVSDNVADLLVNKINRLPDECRILLQVAACFGREVEENILGLVLEHLIKVGMLSNLGINPTEKLLRGSKRRLEEGLLEENGPRLMFVHDQIQSASFQMIPDENVDKMRAEMGKCLLVDGAQLLPDSVLFMAVDLYNCVLGSKSIQLEQTEKVPLAQYNCHAAKQSSRKSAFGAAAAYAEIGLSCLKGISISETVVQDLRFDLATVATEASHCIGNADKVAEYAEIALSSPEHSLIQKARVYQTKVSSLAALKKYDAALDMGVFVMHELGFTNMPDKPGMFKVIRALQKTEALSKRYNKEKLCSLPMNTDERFAIVMKLTQSLGTVSYTCRPNLFLVMSLSNLRWTIKYGITKYSPPAFAAYGMILCGMGKFREGAKIGTLSEKEGM